MKQAVRCANIDWFEVYALEPIDTPCDADYFRKEGIIVHEREYGTRVFQQMFTLEGADGYNFLEIRRAPASSSALDGILPPNAVHIRLVNRACYLDNCVQLLAEFMNRFHYEFRRIRRVDVCYDFIMFDSGDKPADFVRRYMRHKYAKINQARIHAHGEDTWTGSEWNSLKWGAPTSMVSTKIYCKSQELREVKDKPYIRQAWFECGLIDNPLNVDKDVWRIEFSIQSERNNWYTIEEDGERRNYHSYPNNLEQWNSRFKVWQKFASLVPHYFRFKHYQKGVRKDRCKDKILFDFDPGDCVYELKRVAIDNPRSRDLETLLRKLRQYRLTHTANEIRDAVDILIKAITSDELRDDMGYPFSRAELHALQTAIARRSAGDTTDPAMIIYEIKQAIKEDGVLPF